MDRKTRDDGMLFLTSTSFHDAKLVDVRRGEKYGKACLLLLVDFKTAQAPPAGGNLYEIMFSDGKFVREPQQKTNCYILALDCLSSDRPMRVLIESEYFIGNEPHREVIEIEFSDVQVRKANS